MARRQQNNKTHVGTGIVDQPQAQDHLDIEHYRLGLSDFISACQTPLTVAVQGDWGSGKTNMMQMVERDIAPNQVYRLSDPNATELPAPAVAPVYTIRFNTWQYSQFDLSDSLVLALLGSIASQIQLRVDKTGKKKPQLVSFAKLVTRIAVASALSAGNAALKILPYGEVWNAAGTEVVEGVRAKLAGAIEEQDVSALLVELRASFAAAVAELVELEGSFGRLVVFIDDLDRLEPRRAVELMEALKLFLDVEHCVFVLAIDFAVVEQGVASKYGDSFDSAKARSFFDKIIQVPFQMPLGAYKVDNLIRKTSESMGLGLDNATLESFGLLITQSVRSNPRSIKRLLNTFVLLRGIAGRLQARGTGHAAVQAPTDTQLFAALCLEAAYPALHGAIAELEDGELTELFTDPSFLEDQPSETREKWGLGDSRETTRPFLDQVEKTFEIRGAFSPEALRRALSLASTTSSQQTTSTTRFPKVYTAAERDQLVRSDAPGVYHHYAAAEELVEYIEQGLPGIQVGAVSNNPSSWVIELNGKRVGEIALRKSTYWLSYELRSTVSDATPSAIQNVEAALERGDYGHVKLANHVGPESRSGYLRFNGLAAERPEIVQAVADSWIQLCRRGLLDRE